MSRNVHVRVKWVFGIFAIWLVCIALYLALTINVALKRSSAELNETGFLLQRLISQRVAQHDAHMTTLASLILASDRMQSQLLTQVSESILRFYPRIKAIQEIEIIWREPSTSADVRQIVSTPQDAPVPDYSSLGREIFMQKAGEVKSYISPLTKPEYLLAKKLKDSNPALALVMQVNPELLIDVDELPDWANLKLMLDGTSILEQKTGQRVSEWFSPPQFSQMIDSPSQPLLLTMERPVSLADLIDGISFVAVAAASLIVLMLLGYSLQHGREARRLKAYADMAEQRSIALARETRLAHAQRVNSLGELASGIAHELAQPLTALMSQSRAAERLLEQSGIDNALIKKAMAANVREARRAGDMLKRMRDYISNRPPEPIPVAINSIIHDTVELLLADLEQRHIVLRLVLNPDLPHLLADPVELEQVFNNLIRNAADSLQDAGIADGQITVTTKHESDHIRVEIFDNGPGIAPDVQPRLFEPFFTTKKGGMGLGLALCATLVERVGGYIDVQNQDNGGACFVVKLPIQNRGASV